MPYEYYAENHSWDLTLRSSWNLLIAGQSPNVVGELQVSCLTGAMLLSFCAVESFMNSTAICMSGEENYEKFDYSEYAGSRNFWSKLELICRALELEIDKSSGLFQIIEEMRGWRNSLMHSSPYIIETTKVAETEDSRKLHQAHKSKEYFSSVRVPNAKKFYEAAFDFVELIKKESGLDPRSMASYKVL